MLFVTMLLWLVSQYTCCLLLSSLYPKEACSCKQQLLASLPILQRHKKYSKHNGQNFAVVPLGKDSSDSTRRQVVPSPLLRIRSHKLCMTSTSLSLLAGLQFGLITCYSSTAVLLNH